MKSRALGGLVQSGAATHSSMEMTVGISLQRRAYLTGVTVSCGSRSTCMCSMRRQKDARSSYGSISSDMLLRKRIQRSSTWNPFLGSASPTPNTLVPSREPEVSRTGVWCGTKPDAVKGRNNVFSVFWTRVLQTPVARTAERKPLRTRT